MSRDAESGDLILGVDVGGTQAKLVAVRSHGEQLDSAVVPTPDAPDDEPGNVKRRVTAIRRFFEQVQSNTGEQFRGIGVSSPGLADAENRSMYYLPGKMWGVEGLDWEDALGLGKTARVINDGHAALLAEQWVGAAAGKRDVVLLTLGTGVGGALMLNGQLVQGSAGRAGHFGHIILNHRGPSDIFEIPGSLEWYFGNATVSVRTGGKYASVEELVEGYRAGERLATRHWLDAVDALAVGLVSIINSVDPECFVLGGGITAAREALFRPLEHAMDRYEWRPSGARVPIYKAHLSTLAGAMGAAKYIMGTLSTTEE